MTPSEFLADIGWKFKRRGAWLTMQICPFCGGGRSRDVQTFIVHATDGNYSCSRAKCGAKGSFWGLIVSQGRNPKDYLEAPAKKKRFIYGR